MENQPQQRDNEKRILLLGGLLFVVLGVCALVGSIFWGTSNVQKVETPQEVKNDDARIQEILTLLNTPPAGQTVSFSDLKPGKNEIGGVTLELLGLKSMTKGESKTTYEDELSTEQVERGASPCSNGCDTVTDYYFSYAGENMRLTENHWVSGGTAGQDTSYDVAVLNDKEGSWENIGTFSSEGDMKIIGYGDIIIFSGWYYRYHGRIGEDVLAYNLSEMKTIQTNNYESGTWGIFWADILDRRIHEFYVKNQQLYLFAPKNQCYFLSNQPTYICSKDCDLESTFPYMTKAPDYVYAGCVAGYSFVGETMTTAPSVVNFNDEYAKEAAKYEMILKATDWHDASSTATSSQKYVIPEVVSILYKDSYLSDFQYTASSSLSYRDDSVYDHPKEWLSPLLGRTLNMALAGQGKEAWKMFQEDYASLSKQYPLVDPVDPIQVEHDLRVITDGSSGATSTLNY